MSKVLLIGSGGREHSIAIHLSNSENVSEVVVCPGNAGTARHRKCRNIDLMESNGRSERHAAVAEWCCEHGIELVVVGPEAPLIEGLADRLKEQGVACVGPSARGAQLEASKSFGKALMEASGVATARYQVFEDAVSAASFLERQPPNSRMLVVKADGIAAGKGVIVADTLDEAKLAAAEILNQQNPKFGSANSSRIVIEERLEGEEISVLAFCDGRNVRCLPVSQDHKRAFDNDKGPNTGGMGAVCPHEGVSADMMRQIETGILQPVIDHMLSIGHPYQGILYAGIMLTDTGPYVLEFNCRFGDPETQVLLPLLKTDLYLVLKACSVLGGLSEISLEFYTDRYALCIVLASGGYPDKYETGLEISGIDKEYEGVQIIHAGTNYNKDTDQIVTSGGRVLGIVAISNQMMVSYNLALAAIKQIKFPGCYYRSDIGYRVLNRNYKKSYTYSGAGVNIAAGDELVQRIKTISSSTKRPGTISEIGSFGALFDLKLCNFRDPLLISGTDGVGTKLKIAVSMNKHSSVGKDLVAMCVNDILCHGAEPLYFLDYFATGKLDLNVSTDVITGISNACIEAGCSLIGGETAEMPGIYSNNDYDLAGFAVGAVERQNLLPKLDRIKSGDKIIGLMSNGLHSNGFSLVRKIVASHSFDDIIPFEDNKETLGNILLAPTSIYVKPVLQLLRENKYKDYIHSLSHITGGGLLENVPRSLPNNLKAVINVNTWSIPNIFKWLWMQSSKDLTDFAKTFNLGVGMTLICSNEMSSEICEYLNKECGVQSRVIGEVENRQFKTENRVILNNLASSINSGDLKWLPSLQSKSKTRVGVLISGSGTNLEALLKYYHESTNCSYEISVVLSNVENVRGLDVARMYGIPSVVVSHKMYSSRTEFDDEIDRVLSGEPYNCQLICLAGFMRILGKEFTKKWFGKIINIHPSLLPSFKGAHAHREVLKSGVRLSGATVHFVIENVDSGGIIAQQALDVLLNDTEESLSERIKTEIEHKIYPKALHHVANGDCYLDSENRVIWNRK